MTTQSLPIVTEENLEIFKSVRRDIEQMVVDTMLKYAHQLSDSSDDPEKLIRSGYRFTVDMLESIMAVGESALLEDQMQWATDRLPIYGVPFEHIQQGFITYRLAFEQALPLAAAKQILPYFDWLLSKNQELINGD